MVGLTFQNKWTYWWWVWWRDQSKWSQEISPTGEELASWLFHSNATNTCCSLWEIPPLCTEGRIKQQTFSPDLQFIWDFKSPWPSYSIRLATQAQYQTNLPQNLRPRLKSRGAISNFFLSPSYRPSAGFSQHCNMISEGYWFKPFNLLKASLWEQKVAPWHLLDIQMLQLCIWDPHTPLRQFLLWKMCKALTAWGSIGWQDQPVCIHSG